MCFSAPASFAASAGLAVIAIAAIRQAKTRPVRILAFIPVIFSVQQLAEGCLWLSLPYTADEYLSNVSMYIFLTFAQVVWPAYIPFAIYVNETSEKRKRIIGWLTGLGMLTSAYLLYCLLFYPVQASIDDHHIAYTLNFPLSNKWYSGITYMLATVGAPLLSGMKQLKYLGILLLVSYIITSVIYSEYLISVWCYFAAILSIYILYIIRQKKLLIGHSRLTTS